MSKQMDARTLEALEGSVKHWEQVCKNPTTTPIGQKYCDLCELFWASGCTQCPVRLRTGLPGCQGTPYRKFITTLSKEAAQAELDFLKSLLPVQP